LRVLSMCLKLTILWALDPISQQATRQPRRLLLPIHISCLRSGINQICKDKTNKTNKNELFVL
jgi:hypothetical protein